MGKRKRESLKTKTSFSEPKRRKIILHEAPKGAKTSSSEMSSGVTSKNAVALARKLVQIYTKNKNEKDAPPMKKYMRGRFEFFGLKAPIRRSLAQECIKTKPSGPQEVRDLVKILWAKPQRELQYFAIDYLIKHFKTFGVERAEFDANIESVKNLVTAKSWWDTVDLLSSETVGGLVRKHPDLGKPLMEEWINDDNMWLRRTALLHQLKYKETTDEEMLFRFCSARAHEKEFFIQKAIGWALRSYAWTNGAAVKKYLLKNKQILSKLSYKEGGKHLTGV